MLHVGNVAFYSGNALRGIYPRAAEATEFRSSVVRVNVTQDAFIFVRSRCINRLQLLLQAAQSTFPLDCSNSALKMRNLVGFEIKFTLQLNSSSVSATDYLFYGLTIALFIGLTVRSATAKF
jgi:hypothetical protein